ncbi:hypothetical protein [Nocardia sp. NPDC057353]|uniref:hypothetical protein n=1 Tax=Nocardia sp. NPDC057353 TaxID=3346104 RepID=UPI00362FB653
MSTPKRPVNRVTSKRRPAPADPAASETADSTAAGEPASSETADRSAASEAADSPAAGEAADKAAADGTAARKSVASGAAAATPAAGPDVAGEAAASGKVGLGKAATADEAASAGDGAAGGGPASAAPAGESTAPTSGLRGWGVPVACVLAAAVLAGFAVVAALRPGVPDGDKAFVDTAATEEVRAAADNALKTIYAYDVTAIDGYPDAVRQVVTGDMLKDLDQFAPTTIEAIKQSQTSATAAADPIGVTLLTDDRAELLVNLVVSATKDGAAQQSVAGPVVLRMQKVDGRWLAAEIVDR